MADGGVLDEEPEQDPDGRWALEASASLMPRAMGPMILSSVQMAATAMAPAPMKRTSEEKIVHTLSGREPSMRPAVRIGSSTAKEMTRPTSMAMPTVMPTR